MHRLKNAQFLPKFSLLAILDSMLPNDRLFLPFPGSDWTIGLFWLSLIFSDDSEKSIKKATQITHCAAHLDTRL